MRDTCLHQTGHTVDMLVYDYTEKFRVMLNVSLTGTGQLKEDARSSTEFGKRSHQNILKVVDGPVRPN